jgi:hypothetical protein
MSTQLSLPIDAVSEVALRHAADRVVANIDREIEVRVRRLTGGGFRMDRWRDPLDQEAARLCSGTYSAITFSTLIADAAKRAAISRDLTKSARREERAALIRCMLADKDLHALFSGRAGVRGYICPEAVSEGGSGFMTDALLKLATEAYAA